MMTIRGGGSVESLRMFGIGTFLYYTLCHPTPVKDHLIAPPSSFVPTRAHEAAV